jgi:hypothetical protein
MEKKTKFAIYTSFYNCSRYVDQIFENILSIEYPDWKWFITDDFSTDGTGEIVREKCKDNPRIEYVEQSRKKEMYWKPNSFISEEYEYILLVCPDDKVNSRILEVYDYVIREVYRKSPSIITCDLQEIQEEDLSLKSIGYVVNYSNIIEKLNSYYPQVDYNKNINYFAFGLGMCFKNYPDLDFEISDFSASSEDFYRILYMSSLGKWVHVPRNLYSWTARSDSESRKEIDLNFYNNFEIAFDKCKDSLYEPVYDYNECYKELNSLLIEKDIERFTNISIISPWISSAQKDRIQEIYPEKKIKFNDFDKSDLYSIISNYTLFGDSLSKTLLKIKEKNSSGKIIVYSLDENVYSSAEEATEGSQEIFEKIQIEISKIFSAYSYFIYRRHINFIIEI